MKIVKIEDPNFKCEIGESILRQLPLWFGNDSAIIEYVKNIKDLETWVVYQNDTPIGFASIHKHFSQSAEIHVMGIIQEYHRQGIGHHLIAAIENDLRFKGFKVLTVKTLSESRINKEYEQTRKFYLKNGFIPIEEFKNLWNEENPCLFLVKIL